MALSPINFFPTAGTHGAGNVQQFSNLTELSSLTGVPAATLDALGGVTNQQTLNTFAGILGQLLADTGPLTLNTALGGTAPTTAAPATALTNTFFQLLLLTQLGQTQNTGQNAAQQLLSTQILLNTVNTTGTLGLNTVATNQLLGTLVRQGTNGNLFVQLNNLSAQLDPMLFSASVLAQAFAIGNETGTPA